MLHAFLFGFAYTSGALAAGVTALALWGLYDFLAEIGSFIFAYYVKGVEPGIEPIGEDLP
jgi:hypothetical protein